MSKTITMEEAFNLGRDIESYFEIWETTRDKRDPLIEKWEEYIEKASEKTRIGIVTPKKKESTH